MASPTVRSVEEAKHLVRYMLGTRDMALFFDRDFEDADDLVVMTDSDWAEDPVTRKARTAVGKCLLYSFTSKQAIGHRPEQWRGRIVRHCSRSQSGDSPSKGPGLSKHGARTEDHVGLIGQ